MPYCLIAFILETRGACLASVSAPLAGDCAPRQLRTPLRLVIAPELEISKINADLLKIFGKV